MCLEGHWAGTKGTVRCCCGSFEGVSTHSFFVWQLAHHRKTGGNLSRFGDNSSPQQKEDICHLVCLTTYSEGASHESCANGRQSGHMKKNTAALWLLRSCLALQRLLVLLQHHAPNLQGPSCFTISENVLLFTALTASMSGLSRADVKVWAHAESFPYLQKINTSWNGVSRWCCCPVTRKFLLPSLGIEILWVFRSALDDWFMLRLKSLLLTGQLPTDPQMDFNPPFTKGKRSKMYLTGCIRGAGSQHSSERAAKLYYLLCEPE